MRKLLGLLLALSLAAPVAAQVVAPSPQAITVQDSGTKCSLANACATWRFSNAPSFNLQITGTFTLLTFQITADGLTWVDAEATNLTTGIASTTTAAAGIFAFTNTGLQGIRVVGTTISSGGANISAVQGLARGGGGGGSGGFGNFGSLTVGTTTNRQFFFDGSTGLSAFGQTGNTQAVLAINRAVDDAVVQFGENITPTWSVSGVEGTGIRINQTLAAGVAKTNGAGIVVEVPTMGIGSSYGAGGYFSALFRGTHGAGGTFNNATTLAVETSQDRTVWIASDSNPTTPAGGIYFGSSIDTDLYRLTTSLLATDGKMRMTGLGVVGSPDPTAAISIGTSSGAPSSGGTTRLIYNLGTIPSTTTTVAHGYTSELLTQAAAFTLTDLFNFHVVSVSIGAGSAVTNQYAFRNDPMTGAANNFGVVVGKASTATLWIDHTADDTTTAAGFVFGLSKDTGGYRCGAACFGITGGVSQSGKTTTYNNIATAGWGVGAIQAEGRATAQVAANASVATYTVGAADGSFVVSANVLVTTATTHTFTVTCTYTDEGNTSRVVTMNFSTLAGVISNAAITNIAGTVPYEGVPLHIRAKAATAITIATTGTFTTVVYNVEGAIVQVAKSEREWAYAA